MNTHKHQIIPPTEQQIDKALQDSFPASDPPALGREPAPEPEHAAAGKQCVCSHASVDAASSVPGAKDPSVRPWAG